MLDTLIVDDHPAQRLFLERMLRSGGHEPRCAGDGREALAMIDKTMPDICFLDWMMPGLSGPDLVREVRKRSGGERCHIVMLTSKASDEDLAFAFGAGVDDYMKKPVSALELHARTSAALRLAGLHRSLANRVSEVSRLNRSLSSANEQLEVLASTDAMTGLLNRRSGMRRLSEAWSAATRHPAPLAVAMVDVDHFKQVNDRFGHARGDAAIRHVAAVLQDQARDTDIVARIGGEEFLVILPQTDAAQAMVCLERTRQRMQRARCHADGHEMTLTVSIGIAQRTPECTDVELLLQQADKALYSAKDAGRNRIMLADAVCLGSAAAAA